MIFFSDTSDGNISYHVTDDKQSVDKARANLAIKYNFDLSSLHYMEQIHSNIVKEVSDDINPQRCDALITNKKDTPLMVMVADCIPIIFYDPIQEAIGVAHAGREGTFQNISKNTVDALVSHYQCDPKNIEVTLGPSIQKCCYEVSNEIANYTAQNFGKEFVSERYIDLQKINTMQLLNCGIKKENISVSNICTKCSNKPYFSYRKDKNCGRFAGVAYVATFSPS
jgi:YfiH family protein